MALLEIPKIVIIKKYTHHCANRCFSTMKADRLNAF